MTWQLGKTRKELERLNGEIYELREELKKIKQATRFQIYHPTKLVSHPIENVLREVINHLDIEIQHVDGTYACPRAVSKQNDETNGDNK